MAEEKEKKDEEESPQKSGILKNKKILISLVAILLLIVIIVVVLVLVFLGGGEEVKKETGTQENIVIVEDPDGVLDGAFYEMEPFIVNLKSPRRFAKVGLVIEFYDFLLPETIDEDLPPMRDSMIRVLASKTIAELSTPRAKDELRKQLISAANEWIYEGGEVVDIYFTEFILQ